MKKLKLEDTCLTIEQVRELQSLGIDFSNAVMEFTHYDNDGADEWFLTIVDDYADSEFADIENMPTLTNTEMLEMLPKVMISEDESIFTLMLERSKLGRYTIGYVDGETRRYSVAIFNDSIRDLLFDMLKWLKTNKLI